MAKWLDLVKAIKGKNLKEFTGLERVLRRFRRWCSEELRSCLDVPVRKETSIATIKSSLRWIDTYSSTHFVIIIFRQTRTSPFQSRQKPQTLDAYIALKVIIYELI